MRVLITGGSGFIGLAVAAAVLRDGATQILLADRPPPPSMYTALGAEVEVRIADIRDGAALARVIASCAPTHIVHGAALTPGPLEEVEVAETLLTVNVAGTAALMKAARHIPRVLMLSSIAAYGMLAPAPDACLDEDRTPMPTALYGISKFAAEMTARRLAERLGSDLVIARLGPVFGPFEHETGVRNIMSPQLQMLREAAAGQDTILSWRLAADWIYSRDVATAVLSLLHTPSPRQRLFNIGSGVISDMLEWARLIGGVYPTWNCRLAQPGEQATIIYGLSEERAPMATHRLAAETGFAAAYDLRAAAADYLPWFRSHQF